MIIYTVLKSGGPYGVEYVERISDALSRCSDVAYFYPELRCLTDFPEHELDHCCEVRPLKHNWPGWWSKIELFRPDLPNVPAIYLDLDTIILGDIEKLGDIAERVEFASLRGFNQNLKDPDKKENFASGVMAGSFYKLSHIYEKFKKNTYASIRRNSRHRDWRHGDQGFIAECIDVDKVPRIQSLTSENYIIGKRYLRNHNNQIPEDTRLIAWSGSPRLHELPSDNVINRLWRNPCQN